MIYHSTRSDAIQSDFCGAMKTALAPDGGLYVPASFPARLRKDSSYEVIAAEILAEFTGFDTGRLLQETKENYTDFPVKLVHTESGNFLELFHGPSGAFKDIALTMLPRLAALCGLGNTTYVTATSGDTGKAAMEALKNRSDAKIMVLYPKDGVAFFQQKQMETQDGDNVKVLAVEGNFDDAQRAVKQILSAKLPGVSSCNSINIARLISQIPYYFLAAQQMPADRELTFFVPCGNFGNILAGWYAKQMGLPVKKLVVCTNENTVLRDFFETGVYDRRRELVKTVSPSMDILVSSNLERLLYHLIGAEETAIRMQQLETDGVFQIPVELLSDFSTYGATEEEVRVTIRTVLDEADYLIDPHTACARVAWEKFGRPDDSVVLATASPSKFPETIVAMLHDERYATRESLLELAHFVEIHPAVQGVLDKEVRFTQTIRPEEAMRVFTEFHEGRV